MNAIIKHLKIHGMFIKNCLITQMEYRFNFFMGLIIGCFWFLVKMLSYIIVYQCGAVINGWSPDMILLYTGASSILMGLFVTLFIVNIFSIQNNVNSGMLDTYIVKPVSLQFIISTRHVEYSSLLQDVVGGIIITVIAWRRLSIPVNFATISSFLLFLFSGLIIMYSIHFAIQLLSFLFIKIDSFVEIADSIFALNNMPMAIYSKWIQKIGMFFIPVFLITNFAPMILLNKLEFPYIVWGLTAPLLFLLLSRILWKILIKRYSSASS